MSFYILEHLNESTERGVIPQEEMRYSMLSCQHFPFSSKDNVHPGLMTTQRVFRYFTEEKKWMNCGTFWNITESLNLVSGYLKETKNVSQLNFVTHAIHF